MSESVARRSGTRERQAVAWLPEQWRECMQQWGEPPFRAQQIFQWVHRHGVLDVEQMTNLGRALRARLQEHGLVSPLSEESVRRSTDGTRKLLLRLTDGLAIECVMIPRENLEREAPDEDQDEDPDESAGEDRGEKPVTLCISTQVGCAMGCVFCASGQAGLKRGLGAHEVVAQYILARRHLDPGERIKNIVFMGMGEPLHHYAETAQSIRLLTHPEGAGLSPRRITVSTVGLISGIQKLGQDFAGKIGLAISLHAPDAATRSRIVPMNESQPLADLIDALRRYPLPKRRRITIEYTLIHGVNDGVEHARRLVQTLRGLPVKVNLIPMNPIAASSMRAPQPEAVEAFRRELALLHVSCSVRQTRGDDVDAACGQLALGSPLRVQGSAG
ncbi:MAG TPA: 23S rRNA (adenine(2503)-C(2))-methyltransferase RlmN [Polyangiaceae bacterium]|nr:23S rRNA (adenine(2503)-C(2))-methyltransferase RlmN [Polyangiaceae bacterium]